MMWDEHRCKIRETAHKLPIGEHKFLEIFDKSGSCGREIKEMSCLCCDKCCELEDYDYEILSRPLESPVLDKILTSKINDYLRYYKISSTKNMYRISNPLLNYALVSVAIEQKRVINFVGIYECNHETVVLTNLGTMSVVQNLDVDQDRIVCSTIKLLNRLKEYNFCHGDPDASYLKIVEGSLTIDPSIHSSISFKNARVYNSPLPVKILFEIPKIEFMNTSVKRNGKKVKVSSFMLTPEYELVMKNYGVFVHSAEIDLYYFLCSLRTYSFYREYMETDPKFIGLWEGLWGENSENVSRDLYALEHQDKHSHKDLCSVIQKYPLLIDAVDFAFDYMEL